MRTEQLYDAASIIACSMVQDRLAIAAREQMIHEARNRAPIAEVGHLLICFGRWLQMMAQRPTYQEETV
ncbi:MAG: hypothetical protein M3Y58_06010 [Chloroflexota bacterium]|nr:hypothetical protein [Chloroflexota bacterium]